MFGKPKWQLQEVPPKGKKGRKQAARVQAKALKGAKLEADPKMKKAKKLLKLQIDLGYEQRQVVSGIAAYYTPEQLVGKKVIIVANLKPAKLRGVESHGMLLAAGYKDADGNENIKITFLDESVPEGSVIR